MILTLVLMTWALLFTGSRPEGEGTVRLPAVIEHIMALAGDERPWARPIEAADMELMEELEESGWTTFHAAEWWVKKDEDER
ncbi:MAG: hypothetical protein AVO35_09525 [Candidatus Aegiribacteria sp. MLS_C]|nr:MAG: hypothetical protein AVO35_09525 [Candidatus Aegiribacteria sp. MLS_C]